MPSTYAELIKALKLRPVSYGGAEYPMPPDRVIDLVLPIAAMADRDIAELHLLARERDRMVEQMNSLGIDTADPVKALEEVLQAWAAAGGYDIKPRTAAAAGATDPRVIEGLKALRENLDRKIAERDELQAENTSLRLGVGHLRRVLALCDIRIDPAVPLNFNGPWQAGYYVGHDRIEWLPLDEWKRLRRAAAIEFATQKHFLGTTPQPLEAELRHDVQMSPQEEYARKEAKRHFAALRNQGEPGSQIAAETAYLRKVAGEMGVPAREPGTMMPEDDELAGYNGVLHDIENERNRQIYDLGHTAEHDDALYDDALVRKAMVYLLGSDGSPRVNTVKAAALLVAQIERMDRARAKS